MNKESIVYGVVGLVAGGIIAGFSAAYAVNNNNSGVMRFMGMHDTNTSQGVMNNSDMSMDEIATSLKSKSGDEFDKAFLTEMIAHHQGAIEMANLAKQNAKHEEIKNLANDIVTAQTKEITEMVSWQSQWSYKTSSSTGSHDMMDTGH